MEIEIPFQEITIPEGFEATIDGNKIILKKIESEDEKIRKELLSFCQNRADNYPNDPKYANIGNRIAWLEKQDGQKPSADKPKFEIGDEIKTDNEDPLTITKIDEQGYWSEDLFICGFDDAAKWKLVEQKPAKWSEEELTDFEKSLKHVMEETLECGDIHNFKADADLLLRLVKPTDGDMKEALRTEYEKGRADAIAQMQELTWKPSDEQMYYLSWIANVKLGDGVVEQAVSKCLNSLYDDLKKLKGE